MNAIRERNGRMRWFEKVFSLFNFLIIYNVVLYFYHSFHCMHYKNMLVGAHIRRLLSSSYHYFLIFIKGSESSYCTASLLATIAIPSTSA